MLHCRWELAPRSDTRKKTADNVPRWMASRTDTMVIVTTSCSCLFFSLHFNSHFPGGTGWASTSISLFWMLLERQVMEVVVTTGAIIRAKLQPNHHQQTNTQFFLQAGCPSCRPTKSVRALKGNFIT